MVIFHLSVSVVLNQGQFCTAGNIWQHLRCFWLSWLKRSYSHLVGRGWGVATKYFTVYKTSPQERGWLIQNASNTKIEKFLSTLEGFPSAFNLILFVYPQIFFSICWFLYLYLFLYPDWEHHIMDEKIDKLLLTEPVSANPQAWCPHRKGTRKEA